MEPLIALGSQQEGFLLSASAVPHCGKQNIQHFHGKNNFPIYRRMDWSEFTIMFSYEDRGLRYDCDAMWAQA